MADEVDRLIEDVGSSDWDIRRRAARALSRIGDARAVEPLVEALKDKDLDIRWRAARALGKMGDVRAVEPLIKASDDRNEAIRKEVANALEEIQMQLSNINNGKSVSIICNACFCHFNSHRVKSEFLTCSSYYACRNCHGSSFIKNVAKVVATFDRSCYRPHRQTGTTLVVNWYSHKEPFDFEEIWIRDANDFDVDELVMKLKNDMDDKRRKRYKSIPVYVSPQVQLSQAQMHMLKDTFGGFIGMD